MAFWVRFGMRLALHFACIAFWVSSEMRRALHFGLGLKAGVNVKAVFTSLNIALSTIWQFCVNFWVIFRCFGKERFFLKG